MNTSSPRNLAVLVGNGLSVAFNPELELRKITEEVLNRIRDLDGNDAVEAMKEIAERALPGGATSNEDFEMLVGAFGSESRTLGALEDLAELTAPKDADLRKAIKKVSEFAMQVRDNGISHVLEVITERSHAYQSETKHLHSLVTAVIEEFDGDVVFANLNYDTLLLAALLSCCQADVADMGHGWKTADIIVGENVKRTVHQLRTSASDFPSDHRVKLLHLHGSLTYWAQQEGGGVHVKIQKDQLVDLNLWSAIRDQSADVRPVVVLANGRDKPEHVQNYPFSLAYDMYSTGLSAADHWLIVGYSFRDQPVNRVIREEFMNRVNKPRVLVVTHGDTPSRRTIEREFGWGKEDGPSSSWLTINRDGANGAEDSDDWADFVGD